MASNPSKVPWWLQPRFPELDANGDDFCDYTPVPKPDSAQLDTFFWAESSQMLQFGGLRDYESRILEEVEPYTPRPPMPKGLSGYGSEDFSENEEETSGTSASSNDSDGYSIDDEPGGASLFPIHKMTTAAPRPWMERDFVEVDETKWFKLFRRERWASYFNLDPSQLSVDISNDKDWGKLSRVIEIANRVLNEAVDQEWLVTFLDPQARDTRGPVSSGNHVKSWNNTIVHLAVPVPPQARPSREQACKILDDFADSIFWAFHMPDEYAGAAGKTGTYTRTNGRLSRVMTLNLETMEPVFREKTPGDPEGRQCAVGMAYVTLHELAHALSGYFINKMPRSKNNVFCMTNELFFNEERWAEAGYSFEKAVFGTTCKEHWVSLADRIQYFGMRGMNPHICLVSLHWKYDGWALEDPFIDVPLGIPAVVPCAMTTSDFWDVHVKKYGYSSLRWTWVCEGRFETTNGENQMQPAKIMDQPYKYSRYDDLNQSMKAVARKLRKRRLDLKRLRPWYAQEYALWSRTLYAETRLRFALFTLAQTLPVHSFEYEGKANDSIKKLLMPHSPPSDLEAARPEKARTSKMFYHAMGFLAQAALPVRTGTIKYKEYRDSSVVQYPDRLRPALRPDFAGDLALLDQVVIQGKAMADAKRIKTLYDNVAPSHNRELCMSNARLAFRRWQVLGFVSAGVARDFELEWELLRRQMDQRPLDDARLDWSPVTWRDLRVYDGEPDHNVLALFYQGKQMEQQSEGVDTDIPAGAIVRPAIPTAPSGPAAAPWIPYYSPGEVGDHQSLDSTSVWCCFWTGQEMAIYDVTDLLVIVPWNWSQRDDVTRPAPMPTCRVARHDVDQEWIDRFTSGRPLGYVAALRKQEDIRINDGKEGRPLWVMAGEDVYDVTNVELRPELRDLEAIFTGAPNEDPIAEAVHQGYHPDVIQGALRPYRIGWVQKAFQATDLTHHVFTASEVKWHTTRETGIYIIIRGMVYNFTELIDQHPGGSSIIAQVAGTDATSDWDTFHDEPMTDFGFNVHDKLASLKIGRVIEERMATTMTLSPTEICIRNFIYSKERIAQCSPNDDILKLLDGLWGTDGTADMEKPNPSAGYLGLWGNPWYIVAKMTRPPTELPYMSPNILAKMDGRERPDGFNESWVSADCVVYNITSLVRYSTPTPIVDKLKLRAGSCLDDKVAEDHELITWLKSNCSHRAIGVLHTPKHGLNSASKLVAWKTSYRRTPVLTPKAVPQAGGSTPAATPTPAPFTVRPLYPLRKKRKKTNHIGPWYPHAGLPGAASDEQMGEPMDETPDGPTDDSMGDPMDLSRIAARTALEQMGFPVPLGRGADGQKRKTGGW